MLANFEIDVVLCKAFFSLIFLTSVLACLSFWPAAYLPEYGSVTADGQTYRTILLHDETWLAENLNLSVENSWCYKQEDEYCQNNGRLYTWEAAQIACKQLGPGWRLPTKEEWGEIARLFGGVDEESEDGGAQAYEALIENGFSGFEAGLGGLRDLDGDFYDLGFKGYYWSATEGVASTLAYRYHFYSDSRTLRRHPHHKMRAYSCRCIQDKARKADGPD